MTVAIHSYVNKKASIAKADSQSTVIDSEGFTAIGICMPAVWTAASISFLVAATEDGPWLPLYDIQGNEVIIVADVDEAFTVSPTLTPWRFFKIRSGVAATPVVQGDERVFNLAMKEGR